MKRWMLLSLLLVGCGDPLVGETFLGTPVFSIEGAVVMTPTARTPTDHGDVQISLFWIGVNSLYQPTIGVEQRAELTSGLGEYSMTLFDPPPDDSTTFSDLLDSDGEFGLALVVVYADGNGDQVLDLGVDTLLGASQQHLIGYANRPLEVTDRASDIVGTIEAGYHLFEHDQSSACRFVEAASCEGEGNLRLVPNDTRVVLTLHQDAANVIVPAPRLVPMGTVRESIWSGR